MDKKTPLYDEHVALGGKIVPFGGYLLPVQYPTGVITEHMAVRTKCGLFDVSHMGEVIFEGGDALENINRIFTNDFTDMEIGRVRYSVMCYDNGGAVDDLLVHKVRDDKFFVVVNASNKDKDVEWITPHIKGDCAFTDISDTIAQIAVQGPFAEKIMRKLTDNLPKKYYTFIPNVDIGFSALIAKTGYTGESGYEIYMDAENAVKAWRTVLEAGKEFGIIPCGLGARDTLRLEAAMPLYGHEMDSTVNPLETSLDFGVKMNKDFIGRDAIASALPAKRERIGLEIIGRGIAREHQDVYLGDTKIGVTTSGTYLPFIEKACAMALVDTGRVSIGDEVEIDVRGRKVSAKVVPLPFYKKPSKAKK